MGVPTAAYIADQKTLHGGSLVIPSARAGVADDSQLFKSAMIRARDARTSTPGASHIVTPSPKVIPLRPGIYTVRQALALMGAEGLSAQTRGLHFQGAGSGVTTIVFSPSSAGVMCQSSWWQNVRFSGVTFACAAAAAGSTFLRLDNATDANAGQDYIFDDVSWIGPWKYLVDPHGVNNASEMRFISCEAHGLQDDGAWLHIGDTDTSDQMLNFWFFGCKLWSTSASVVDIAKGGSVHIYGLDASDWGKSGSGVLFKLRGSTHARGVTQFHAQGVRAELKSATSSLLHSEWDDGNVSLQADIGSQADVYTYGTMIDIRLGNANGAAYRFHDSVLAGKIAVQTGSGAWSHAYSITVEDSTWLQAQRPSDVVIADASGMDLGAPVTFIRCRPEGYSSALEGGFAVWDATVGRGQMALPTTKRSIRLTDVWGGLASASTSTVHLPVGAIITGFRALSPAGATSDTDGGTFTLKASDGTSIGTAVVAGPTAAGYSAGGDLPKPFLCSSQALATVKVTTDMTSTPHDAQVIIEGYW